MHQLLQLTAAIYGRIVLEPGCMHKTHKMIC